MKLIRTASIAILALYSTGIALAQESGGAPLSPDGPGSTARTTEETGSSLTNNAIEIGQAGSTSEASPAGAMEPWRLQNWTMPTNELDVSPDIPPISEDLLGNWR